MISGTIEAQNPNNKPIRIDIFDGDQRNIGGKRPSVVGVQRLNQVLSLKYFCQRKNKCCGWGHTLMKMEMVALDHLDPSGWYGESHFTEKLITLVLS